MAVSTVAGCLFLTATYLSCVRNPLSDHLLADRTTASARFIEIIGAKIDSLEYDEYVWLSLQEVYMDRNIYVCRHGVCYPNMPSSTTLYGVDTSQIIDTDKETGIFKSTIPQQAETTEIKKPVPTPSTTRDLSLPSTLDSPKTVNNNYYYYYDQVPNSSQNNINADEDYHHSNTEEIILGASTGVFSLATLLSILRYLSKNKRYVRYPRYIFGNKCCRCGYNEVTQEEDRNEEEERREPMLAPLGQNNENNQDSADLSSENTSRGEGGVGVQGEAEALTIEGSGGAHNVVQPHINIQIEQTFPKQSSSSEAVLAGNVTTEPAILEMPEILTLQTDPEASGASTPSPPPLQLRKATERFTFPGFRKDMSLFNSISLGNNSSSVFGDVNTPSSSSNLFTPILKYFAKRNAKTSIRDEVNSARLNQVLTKMPKQPHIKKLDFNETFYQDTPM